MTTETETETPMTTRESAIVIDVKDVYDDAVRESDRGQWRHRVILDPASREVSIVSTYGNGTPMPLWDGRWIALASIPDGTADTSPLVSALEGLRDDGDLDRLCDEHETYWDGSNNRGRLSEAGDELLQVVSRQLGQIELPTYWSAADWAGESIFGDLVSREGPIDLGARAKVLVDEASANGAHVDVGDLARYLEERLAAEIIEEAWDEALNETCAYEGCYGHGEVEDDEGDLVCRDCAAE